MQKLLTSCRSNVCITRIGCGKHMSNVLIYTQVRKRRSCNQTCSGTLSFDFVFRNHVLSTSATQCKTQIHGIITSHISLQKAVNTHTHTHTHAHIRLVTLLFQSQSSFVCFGITCFTTMLTQLFRPRSLSQVIHDLKKRGHQRHVLRFSHGSFGSCLAGVVLMKELRNCAHAACYTQEFRF